MTSVIDNTNIETNINNYKDTYMYADDDLKDKKTLSDAIDIVNDKEKFFNYINNYIIITFSISFSLTFIQIIFYLIPSFNSKFRWHPLIDFPGKNFNLFAN